MTTTLILTAGGMFLVGFASGRWFERARNEATLNDLKDNLKTSTDSPAKTVANNKPKVSGHKGLDNKQPNRKTP